MRLTPPKTMKNRVFAHIELSAILEHATFMRGCFECQPIPIFYTPGVSP